MGNLRLRFDWRLTALLALSLFMSGCEVFKLAMGQYGAIRGKLVDGSGAPISYAEFRVAGNGPTRYGTYAGMMYEDEVGEDDSRVEWHDFADGKGNVLALAVPAFDDVDNTWLRYPGRPTWYFLRHGEFVVDHVAAGMRHILLEAYFDVTEQTSATSTHSYSLSVEMEVPVSVAPDQWADIRIVVPSPTPTPPPDSPKPGVLD